jgi:two-component system response regulator PilR (NtrC family)
LKTLPPILLVDDEPDLLDLMELTLAKLGLECQRAGSVQQARAQLGAHAYALCLTDMRLPDGSGLDVLADIHALQPQTPVAVITAFGNTENAVAALKAGAFDYLAKPLALDQLRALVRSAIKVNETRPANANGQLLGESAAMQEVRSTLDKVARTQAAVHIHGESGSGKELASHYLHRHGPRSEGPFIAVNCGAIPENLMESEFFGYRKGAFTGADADKTGYFQAAHGGTLFLDEVAELPLPMQVKLLRVLQEKRVRPVGAMQEHSVDVRIISATHQKLGELVEQNRFRQDLYYRLDVIPINLPSLRERAEDIPGLAQALLARMTAGRPLTLSRAALDALARYHFPGNVRELENILERAAALADGQTLELADLQLQTDTRLDTGCSEGNDVPGTGGNLQDDLDRYERSRIVQALEHCRYNKTAAARLLGVTFRSLRYRIERLGIE